MQEKNPKTGSLNDQEKGFAILRTDTIQLWVWLDGKDPLDEQSLKSLSEDVTYRIREVTDCAVSYMRNCKRTQLQTSDLNKAFEMANIEKTFGYSNKLAFKYNKINKSEAKEQVLDFFRSDLFEVRDKISSLKLVSLNDEDESDKNSKDNQEKKSEMRSNVQLHGKWLIVNGNCIKPDRKVSYKDENQMSFSLDDLSYNYENFDIENEVLFTPLTDVYKQYFDMLTSIVLGLHDSDENEEALFLRILNDVRTNSKLQPIIPYVINFICQTIQTLTNSVSNRHSSINVKINLRYMERVVQLLKNLILNKSLFLAPKGFHVEFVSARNASESLKLRENSSFVLVMFLKLYQRYSSSSIKYIMNNFFVPNLKEKSFECQPKLFTLYGILLALRNFGGPIIHELYPKLIKVAFKLNEENVDKNSTMAMLLSTTFLNSFLVYFKWLIKRNHSNPTNISSSQILLTYNELNSLFGDYFVHQINAKNVTVIIENVNEKGPRADEILGHSHVYRYKCLNEISNKEVISITDVFENDTMSSKLNRKRKININLTNQINTQVKASKNDVEISSHKRANNLTLIGKLKSSRRNEFSSLYYLYNQFI